MRLVITSATEKELMQIRSNLDSLETDENKLDISFHISGVGMLSSCFSLTKMIFEQKPELILQAGIAGSFNRNLKLGEVVIVKDEIVADTGVEEDGDFKDLFDLNLQQKDVFPYTGRTLRNHFLDRLNYVKLDEVTGVTINEISTRSTRIAGLIAKYHPTLESMEGAALHYTCLHTAIPFIQIRAISNYVGERDKSKWEFKMAFDNLNNTVMKYIHKLQLPANT